MAAGVFSVWDVPRLELDEFRALGGPKTGQLGARQLRYFVALSLLAPTTHNSVPQTYRISVAAQRVGVLLSRNRVLPASDPTGRQALASLGCVVENLIAAAAQYGVTATWSCAPDLRWDRVTHAATEECVEIGEVHFHGSETPPNRTHREDVLRALCERKVVRAEFDAAERLPAEVVRALTESAQNEGGVRLQVFDDERQRFSWAKLDELATKHKLEEHAFRRELGTFLLPNDDLESARGMRGYEFGIDDRVAALLPAQLRGERAMPGDLLAFMARASRAGLTSASAVCVVSCPQHSPQAAVTAGRVYQRCALIAFRHGFSHAVHSAVCEVSHARAMSKAVLLGGNTPAVIFRVGRPLNAADGQRPHSSRPLIDDLLLGE